MRPRKIFPSAYQLLLSILNMFSEVSQISSMFTLWGITSVFPSTWKPFFLAPHGSLSSYLRSLLKGPLPDMSSEWFHFTWFVNLPLFFSSHLTYFLTVSYLHMKQYISFQLLFYFLPLPTENKVSGTLPVLFTAVSEVSGIACGT